MVMGILFAQLVPSHSHVSSYNTLPSKPPNRTVMPRALSKAMSWATRPVGASMGCGCDQLPGHWAAARATHVARTASSTRAQAAPCLEGSDGNDLWFEVSSMGLFL